MGETVLRRLLRMWDLSLQRWSGKPQAFVPGNPVERSEGMSLVAGLAEPFPLEVCLP